MSQRTLIPYAGAERSAALPPRVALQEREFARVLSMFRAGQDTFDIAKSFHCTQGAAANALARARDARP